MAGRPSKQFSASRSCIQRSCQCEQ
jgi:hypothetical protein